VLTKLLWKRKEFTSICGAAGPIDDGLVLRKFRNFPKPLCSARARNGDDIGDVARSQAAADGELNPFQQSSCAPFFLEPLHGNRRSAVGRISAAAALANNHVSDDETLGGQRKGIVAIHEPLAEGRKNGVTGRIPSATPAPPQETGKRGHSQVCSQKRQAEAIERNSR
jgi:hypothetical protein